jgi:hypothetical protein
MKNTFKLYFNIYQSSSFTLSLAGVSSRSRKYHSWVTWFLLKESRWTSARWERSWIGSLRCLCPKWEDSLGWLAIIEGPSELLQDCKVDHRVIEEEKQVCLEWRLWWSLLQFEEVVDHIACARSARHHQAFRCSLWCFWQWLGRYLNARRLSDFIVLMTTKASWRALPYSWSWVSSSTDGIENMATLSAWECGSYLYGKQKPKLHL